MATKIKSVHFTKDSTIIGFVESYQLRDANDPHNDKTPGKHMDLPRHADFIRAMDKLKPHLVIAPGFAEPFDALGNILKHEDFNEFFADSKEAPQAFKNLEVTGIIIQGKNASDGVQIVGTKTNDNGDVTKIRTGSIALKRVPDGFNYPLLEILDTQIDTLLSEADKYLARKKHGAGVQTEAALHVKPDTNVVNMNNKKNIEQDDLVASN